MTCVAWSRRMFVLLVVMLLSLVQAQNDEGPFCYICVDTDLYSENFMETVTVEIAVDATTTLSVDFPAVDWQISVGPAWIYVKLFSRTIVPPFKQHMDLRAHVLHRRHHHQLVLFVPHHGLQQRMLSWRSQARVINFRVKTLTPWVTWQISWTARVSCALNFKHLWLMHANAIPLSNVAHFVPVAHRPAIWMAFSAPSLAVSRALNFFPWATLTHEAWELRVIL